MDKEKDTGSIIIKIVASILIVGALLTAVLMLYFNKPKAKENFGIEYAGKYVLTEFSGQNDKNGNPVTPESYDYNYINLGEDGYFEIANKINGKETSEKGVWYVRDGYVYFEMTKMLGLAKYTDKGTIGNNKITMSIQSSDGVIIKMVLTLSE